MYLKNEIIKEKLIEKDYEKYIHFKDNYLDFDEDLLNKYIKIVKEFAFDNLCSEYCFLFCSIDGKIYAKYQTFYKQQDGKIIKDLSKEDLINSEVDASSIESGGLRDITHAKGLVSIDTNSCPFIIDKIMYVPSVFRSIDGLSLDNKIPLYNSIKELKRVLKDLLNSLDYKCEKIVPYLGIEQEFYLIKKEDLNKNKDLKNLNHQLLDHEYLNDNEYLGLILSNNILKDINDELENINIYPKSIHKEVGINQFEISPIYKIQNETLDDNIKLRIVLQKKCEKYGYIANFDDKPYKNLSGSGQHNNYSIFVDNKNLLSTKNKHYLLMISAFLEAIGRFNELLRISSSSYSNERRLGVKEAPTSKITISLGDELENLNINNFLNLDRNRTSPIALLGNRFEFRILGSSIDSTFFNVCLNTALIDVIKDINFKLKAGIKEEEIIKNIFINNRNIISNENMYLNENTNIKYYQIINKLDEYKDIFINNKIISKEEIKARISIYLNKYLMDIIKEYKILKLIIKEDIIPTLDNKLIDISRIKNKYLSEYNIDKIEFIKQITSKFINYLSKIDNLLNKVEDTLNIIDKIDILENSSLLKEVNECYIKLINNY